MRWESVNVPMCCGRGRCHDFLEASLDRLPRYPMLMGDGGRPGRWAAQWDARRIMRCPGPNSRNWLSPRRAGGRNDSGELDVSTTTWTDSVEPGIDIPWKYFDLF